MMKYRYQFAKLLKFCKKIKLLKWKMKIVHLIQNKMMIRNMIRKKIFHLF